MDIDKLPELSRKELQQICKEKGLKANKSTDALVKMLQELGKKDATSHAKVDTIEQDKNDNTENLIDDNEGIVTIVLKYIKSNKLLCLFLL